MIESQLLTAGVTLGASAAVFVAQLVEDNGEPSVGVQGAIVGAGIAVFVFFDRRERKASQERNLERRAADEAKDARIAELEDRVEHLTQRLFDILGGRHDGRTS